MLMLIDTRPPPPWPLSGDERPAVALNWRAWLWLAVAIALFAVGLFQDPAVASLLLFAAFPCAMKALGAALERCDGLRAHKQ